MSAEFWRVVLREMLYRSLAGLLACLVLAAIPLCAQLDRDAITGTVQDPTGAVVPNARILIRNAGTGATYEIVSNELGQYIMRNLPAGDYEVQVEVQA